MSKRLAGGLLALCLTGCGGRAPVAPTPPPAPVADDWRRLATEADRERLREWRTAWNTGLSRARATAAAAIAAQGPLFTLDASLPDPVPPPGAYRCRVFKLGTKTAGGAHYLAYPWFDCRVAASADGEAQLVKLTGSQRPVGTLHRADGMRAAFLGTLMLGDEARAFAYGADQQRDVAGWMERIAPRRWRLVMPYPAFESIVDVMELVPAT